MAHIFKFNHKILSILALLVITVLPFSPSVATSQIQPNPIMLLDDDHNDEDHPDSYEAEVITDFDLADFNIISDENSHDSDRGTKNQGDALDFVLPDYYPVVVEKDHKRYVVQTLRDGTKRLIVMRNGHLANSDHPVTGIHYDELGFPVFQSVHTLTIDNTDLKENNATQFRLCNIDLKAAFLKNPEAYPFTASQREDVLKGKKPKGYTWHHHQNRGVFYLVSTSLHSRSGHTGGRAIWGS